MAKLDNRRTYAAAKKAIEEGRISDLNSAFQFLSNTRFKHKTGELQMVNEEEGSCILLFLHYPKSSISFYITDPSEGMIGLFWDFGNYQVAFEYDAINKKPLYDLN